MAIEVEGAETIIEKVLLTPHGPLISPALEGASAAVSMRATWLDPHAIAGLFEAQTATDFETFRSAFSRWPVLPLNVVYADTKGAIGWQLAGQAPRRKKGVGLVPQHGRDEDAGWHEEGLPFADMPHLVDPACGFVASANNKPQREGEGPYLGGDWVDGYRFSRIVEVLGAHSDWSVERCQQLQLDTRAIPWFEMRDRVLEARGHDATADRGLDLLESWDGRVCPESNAASLYEFFVAEMVGRVVAARAPRSVETLLGEVPNPFDPFTSFSIRRVGHLVRLLREGPAGWFAAGWKAEVAAALRAAWETLEAGWGKDPARWTWGALRPLRLEHPLGAQKRLGAIFNRGPYAVGGDTNTVHQAAVNLLEPSANALYAPTLRAVMDVGRWEESRFALSGGQSGNPFSPHYDDQLRLWLRGEGLAMAWSADEVAAATEKTLRLTSGG
jgi:penicillin amidase